MGRLPADLYDRPRLGSTCDDPRVTPPARIRHDCAVEGADAAALPDDLADGGFELLESPEGLWAMTDMAPGEVADGDRAIIDGWFQGRPDDAMEGGPFSWSATAGHRWGPVVTVWVRVRRIAVEGDFNMAVPPDAPTDATA